MIACGSIVFKETINGHLFIFFFFFPEINATAPTFVNRFHDFQSLEPFQLKTKYFLCCFVDFVDIKISNMYIVKQFSIGNVDSEEILIINRYVLKIMRYNQCFIINGYI